MIIDHSIIITNCLHIFPAILRLFVLMELMCDSALRSLLCCFQLC